MRQTPAPSRERSSASAAKHRHFIPIYPMKSQCRRWFDATLNEHGRVDILVNNAGIFPTSSVEEMARGGVGSRHRHQPGRHFSLLESRRAAFARAAFRTNYQPDIRARVSGSQAWRSLCRVQGGHYWLSPNPSRSSSRRYGITVNVICPGITDTAQPRGHQTEEQIYAQGQRIPLGRIGQPEDLAGPAIFLASDAAGFITGQTILANGGGIMW